MKLREAVNFGSGARGAVKIIEEQEVQWGQYTFFLDQDDGYTELSTLW